MFTLVVPALLSLAAQQAPKPTAQDTDFAAAQTQFALALYRELDERDGNLFFSPFSIARALAMAREGAAGETARQLDAALRFPPEVGGRFAALARALEPLQAGRDAERHAVYSLELATSMWGQGGAPFEAAFLQRLKDGFASELRPTDFRKPDDARAAINAWAAANTGGRVPEIIPEGILSADTLLVLVDTIRFVAAWEDAFKVEATGPAPFALADGGKVEAPTMHRTGRYAYAETPLAQVLELPYERGATSLVVVLPKRADGLAEVVAGEDIALWTARLEQREVEVALPRFRFEWGSELKPALQKLGIALAFDPEHADFTRILRSREPLFVGNVLHRAFVAVDEQGTEAAAATAVVMVRGTKALEPPPPVAFHADHPFLFFMRHRATGAALFVGRVCDPVK